MTDFDRDISSEVAEQFNDAASHGSGEWFDGESYSFRRLGSLKDAQFELLCRRLAGRNHMRQKRAADPQAARDRLNAWRAANRELCRAWDKARRDRKRVWLKLQCQECRVIYSPPKTKNVFSKWCSQRCRNKHHGRIRTLEGRRNRGIRNMRARELVLGALRAAPGSTTRQVSEVTGVKFGSAATLLSELTKAGVVARTGWGSHHQGRYALAQRAQEAA